MFDSLETLAPYLAGPGAGLLVCLLVGLGMFKFFNSSIMPLIEGTVTRHLAQIDEMNERHSKEHEKIMTVCQGICDRLDSQQFAHPPVNNRAVQ